MRQVYIVGYTNKRGEYIVTRVHTAGHLSQILKQLEDKGATNITILSAQ